MAKVKYEFCRHALIMIKKSELINQKVYILMFCGISNAKTGQMVGGNKV